MAASKSASEHTNSQFFALCGVGFLVLASYSFARPPTDSLFLDTFGRDGLPFVWVAVAIAAFVTVTIYNRFAATVPLTRLFVGVCVVSVAFFALLKLMAVGWPGPAIFLLYIWKDLYIVFLVEIFWTYANNVFHLRSARWLYGTFLLAGTLGSFTGNLAVGQLAPALGSATSLWMIVPTLLIAAFGFSRLARNMALPQPAEREPPSLLRSFSVLRGNRYLGLMVALICLAQIVITLIDYQFSGVIEQRYPNIDERTEVIGLVYGAIDVSSLALQIVAGPLLRVIGAGPILLVIPLIISATLTVWLVIPQVATMFVAKVSSKAFDYSIYRAAKELLYLPLSYRDKTQGKAVIDIFSYRVAKLATSVLLLGLIALGSQGLVTALSLVTIAVWVGITLALVRRYRALAGSEEAPAAALRQSPDVRYYLTGVAAGAIGGAVVGVIANTVVCWEASATGSLFGRCALYDPLWAIGGAIIGAVEGVIVQRGLDEARQQTLRATPSTPAATS